jgi:hypothetical protein
MAGFAQLDRQARRLWEADHFIATLVLSLLLVLAVGWDNAGFPGHLVVALLISANVVYAFHTSQTGIRAVYAVAILMTIVTLVLILQDLPHTPSVPIGIRLTIQAVLVIVTPLVIARRLIRHPVISVQTIAGALCVYVLFGLFFAVLYRLVGLLESKPFFAQTPLATSTDFTYFSFVTLTTVGYGDLTTTDGIGRMLAITEALLGQFYLVTAIALLVSNVGRERHRSDEPTGSTAEVRTQTPDQSATPVRRRLPRERSRAGPASRPRRRS